MKKSSWAITLLSNNFIIYLKRDNISNNKFQTLTVSSDVKFLF